MRYLLTFLLFCAASGWAASGDIMGAFIETNGWVMQVQISGMATNTTRFFNGFATNNSLTATNNLRLDLTSMGFDDAGNGIQVARSVYGTKLLRRPYPDQALNESLTNGADGVWCRVALSEYICSRDSNVTATLRAGALVNTNAGAGTESAASVALSVTNRSTEVYPEVIADWSWPGYQLWSSAIENVRCVAFQYFAMQGRPVRSVMFVAQQTNASWAVTNYQTAMRVDLSMQDACPLGEYIGQIENTAFTNGAPVRVDMVIYPWVGDTPLSTFDNKWGYGPLFSSQTNVCDRLGTFSRGYAVVDAVGSVDASIAYATNVWNLAEPPNAFTNLYLAVSALTASNNIWTGAARNDLGGSVIYIKPGQHHWADQHTAGTQPLTWTTVTSYPGSNPAQCIISNVSGTFSAFGANSGVIKVSNLSVGGPANALVNTIWYGVPSLWIDKCWLNCSNVGTVGICGQWYVTRCNVEAFTQGFKKTGTEKTAVPLFRGNTVRAFQGGSMIDGYNLIGNSGRMSVQSTAPQVGPAPPETTIIYNNRFINISNLVCITINTGNTTNRARGAVIANNVIETTNWTANLSFNVSDSGSTNAVTNVLIWFNTLVGGEQYNSLQDGALSYIKENRFINRVGGYWDYFSAYGDIYSSLSFAGCWPIYNSVGSSGEFDIHVYGAGRQPEFAGLNAPTWILAGGTNMGIVKFVDRKSWTQDSTGTTDPTGTPGAGNGNYRLQSSSPLFQYRPNWVLPYDIEGVPRGAIDPPGAYASGNVRKGAFF